MSILFDCADCCEPCECPAGLPSTYSVLEEFFDTGLDDWSPLRTFTITKREPPVDPYSTGGTRCCQYTSDPPESYESELIYFVGPPRWQFQILFGGFFRTGAGATALDDPRGVYPITYGGFAYRYTIS